MLTLGQNISPSYGCLYPDYDSFKSAAATVTQSKWCELPQKSSHVNIARWPGAADTSHTHEPVTSIQYNP